jgi:hypothetical protein
MTTRERLLTTMYQSYLAALPAFTGIPILTPSSEAHSASPMIALTAAEQRGKHRHLAKLQLFARLCVTTRIADGSAVLAGTPIAQAQQLARQLQEALYDETAIRTHITTLTAEQKAWGNILLRDVADGIVHQHQAEDRTDLWEVEVNHSIDTSPEDL